MEPWRIRKNIVRSAVGSYRGKTGRQRRRRFINACQSTDGNTVRFRKVLVEKDGVCFACGQRDQVMYYEL